MNNATRSTCPRQIWMSNVLDGVVARGFDVSGLHAGAGALRDRMNRAYDAGEAVWMMVDEMCLRIHQAKLHAQSWEQDFRAAIRNRKFA